VGSQPLEVATKLRARGFVRGGDSGGRFELMERPPPKEASHARSTRGGGVRRIPSDRADPGAWEDWQLQVLLAVVVATLRVGLVLTTPVPPWYYG
jgi:hypothetical protein